MIGLHKRQIANSSILLRRLKCPCWWLGHGTSRKRMPISQQPNPDAWITNVPVKFRHPIQIAKTPLFVFWLILTNPNHPGTYRNCCIHTSIHALEKVCSLAIWAKSRNNWMWWRLGWRFIDTKEGQAEALQQEREINFQPWHEKLQYIWYLICQCKVNNRVRTTQ